MPPLQAVDNRLFYVDGRRIVRLRKEDLPELARAIVAVVRGRARAGIACVKNVAYVELKGSATDALIIRSDWEKILPYIQDEFFNTQVAPAAQSGRYADHKVAFSEPILDRADKPLYDRIVGILSGLFTDTFPTSLL